MRLRVYLAGPISKGDLLHNIEQAEAAFFELLKAGLAPFCPMWSCYSTGPQRHGGGVYALATQNGGGGATHAEWLGVDLAWVEAADALLRLPGESVGADQEVAKARELGIPVYYHVDDLMDSVKAGAFRHDAAEPEEGVLCEVGEVGEMPPQFDRKQSSGHNLSDLKPSNPNPKDAIGCKKLPLGLLPSTALAYTAMVHLHGAMKYGAYNWRSAGVRSTIYYDAMQRHLAAWLNGQDDDPDSAMPHLAHIAACCNIIMDAKECGKLNDDRPPPAPVAALQARLNEVAKTWLEKAS